MVEEVKGLFGYVNDLTNHTKNAIMYAKPIEKSEVLHT